MDNTKKIELTPEGRQRLVEELAYREGEKHDEIVERIKEARGFGDLSENSEYDQILSVATVVEAGSGELTVSIGTTVELEDEKGAKTSFTIVGTTETNSLEHKISNESPVGAALVGHREGDKIEVVAPSGRSRSYTITAISR